MGVFTTVNVEDLTLLDKNTPKQGVQSSQTDCNNADTDFLRNDIEESSNTTLRTENSRKQKAVKYKFQLRPKAPFTDSSSDSDGDIENTATNKMHKVIYKIHNWSKQAN